MQESDKEEYSPRSISIIELISPVWNRKKWILIVSLAAGALTLGVNFLLPVYYKSTARLLPETEKSKLSTLSQFSDVAQLAGVSIPGSEIARLYPHILTSETVLRVVIPRKYKTVKYEDPVDLMQFLELDEDTPEENLELAVKKMRNLLTTTFDNRTSIVTITLEMREPQLAADVLNEMVAELDKFMRLKRISNASEQRKWVEIRVKEVEHDLHVAEDDLRLFREKNRRVIDSPQLLIEQERRVREVQVKSTVYIELTKQMELAKIEEIKNTAIVNVLDPAIPPVKKERPTRVLNSGLAFLVTFVLSSIYIVLRSVYAPALASIAATMRQGPAESRGGKG